MISTTADLQADARFKATGDSTNTDFSASDTLLYLNQYYGKAISILAGSTAKARLYMEQDTDLIDITAGTNVITPGTDITNIIRVDVKYPSSGSYRKAKFIDINDIEMGVDKYVPESGIEYTFDNGTIILFVGVEAANVEAVTEGVKIYNLTELTELSGASDTPSIVEYYRDYMSTGAAMTYCNANEMYGKADRLKRDLQEAEMAMRKHYANFVKDTRRITPKKENFE